MEILIIINVHNTSIQFDFFSSISRNCSMDLRMNKNHYLVDKTNRNLEKYYYTILTLISYN